MRSSAWHYYLACLTIFTHCILCSTNTTESTNAENRRREITSPALEMFAITSTASSTNISSNSNTIAAATTIPNSSSTRQPRLLRLGNQTVDVNKSFKVPSWNSNPNSIDSVVKVTKLSETSSSASPPSSTSSTSTSTISTSTTTTPIPTVKTWPSRQDYEAKHGPRFEDGIRDNITVIVQAGDTASLDCKVSLLRDKTVSWVRRRTGEAPLLLTVGGHTYTGDPRYKVQFKYPGNWRLQLSRAASSDEGLYECQLSTHPPRVIAVHLHVNSVLVSIVDEGGGPLKEQYYEAGSTLALACQIRGSLAADKDDDERGALVWWLHGDRALHRDTSRGGVAVRSERVAPGIDSSLRVSRLTTADAGNYTCALPPLQPAPAPAAPRYFYTVLVHVLNESLAELQQGQGSHIETGSSHLVIITGLVVLTYKLFAHNS